MNFIKNIIKNVINNEQYRTKREALYQFRSMTDRMLIDCNISRELLKQGVKAWPWQATPDSFEHTQLQYFKHAVALAPSNENTSLFEQTASIMQGSLFVQAAAKKQIENSATDQALVLEQEPAAQRSTA